MVELSTIEYVITKNAEENWVRPRALKTLIEKGYEKPELQQYDWNR